MSRIIEYVRALIIAPEIVVSLTCVLLSLIFPGPFELLGSRFKSEQEAWKILIGIPLAVMIWAGTQVRDVLFPLKDSNRELIDWPDFWRLKMRIYAGLSLLMVFVALSGTLFLYKDEWPARSVGTALGICIIGSFIGAITFWIAGIKIREIVEK